MTIELDISSEEYRVYTYGDNSTFRIENPRTIFVLQDEKGTTHRIIDQKGVTHRPERNWVGISWKPLSGEPAFVA